MANKTKGSKKNTKSIINSEVLNLMLSILSVEKKVEDTIDQLVTLAVENGFKYDGFMSFCTSQVSNWPKWQEDGKRYKKGDYISLTTLKINKDDFTQTEAFKAVNRTEANFRRFYYGVDGNFVKGQKPTEEGGTDNKITETKGGKAGKEEKKVSSASTSSSGHAVIVSLTSALSFLAKDKAYNEVKESLEHTIELLKNVEELKNSKKTRVMCLCGKEFVKGTKFCSACGASLPK